MRFALLFCFVFLLFPVSGKAQSSLSPNSGYRYLPDSATDALTKFFHGTYLYSFETVPYLISSQTEFDTLLDAETKKKIAPIDFSKYDLRWTKYCPQCISNCPNPANPCHRNASQYSFSWMISPKPGMPIAAISFGGNNCENITGRETFLVIEDDTSYRNFIEKNAVAGKTESPDFSKYVLLVCEENRDCNAQFFSAVFQDSATKTITWRLRSSYGGCRGMKTSVHQILVPKMAGYVYRQE